MLQFGRRDIPAICGELPFRGSRMFFIKSAHDDPRPPRQSTITSRAWTVAFQGNGERPGEAVPSSRSADDPPLAHNESIIARPAGPVLDS
jgi:hypothetical protein